MKINRIFFILVNLYRFQHHQIVIYIDIQSKISSKLGNSFLILMKYSGELFAGNFVELI